MLQTIRLILICCFLNIQLNSIAQQKEKSYTINGYVKSLQTVNIVDDPIFVALLGKKAISSNFLHNRLNFKWYVNDNITYATDLRTRIFWGEAINTPFLQTDGINFDAGTVDLSFNIIDNANLLLNTQIDRLWINWFKNKWEVRLGRQRINWGINIAFNPNDLFNTYNYFDFDYEERPGTDALKISYNPNYSSSIEFAFSPGKIDSTFNLNESVSAIKYGFNKWNYDFQLIGGIYKTDIALGIGWAGNVKNGGFKGEATYFIPTIDNQESNLNLALTYDNVFGKMYFQAATLYNLKGSNSFDAGSLLVLSNANLSAKNLFPFKYTFLASGIITLNPLNTITAAIIYSPGVNALILTPSFSHSIASNWALDAFIQSFFLEQEKFKHLTTNATLRLRWSF